MRVRAAVAVTAAVACTLAVLGATAREESEGTSPDHYAAEIAAKEAELAHISGKIRELTSAQEKTAGTELRLTSTVERLEQRALQARLELDHTRVSIEEVQIRLRQVGEEIARLERRQDRLRRQLKDLIRLMARLDRRSPLETLVLEGTFSDFLSTQEGFGRIQARASALLTETVELRQSRQGRQRDLDARRVELEQLEQLQAAQRTSLETQERQQRLALAQTVREAARLASLLAEAEEARREIQQDVFVLKNANLRLSLKQAEEFARYAGGATGVRPALLLGVLRVESNIGTNVGSGRYPDDVHPGHRDAFLRVTERLGLDPLTTPVSARPTSYQGWGGALGPGQILPGTWERVEPVVAQITGKPRPSPFELLDAFVATAVILRNAGAAGGNEYEAVNRYFAGPNWQRFTWYGDRVLAVAREYESRGI